MPNDKRSLLVLMLALMAMFGYMLRPFWMPVMLAAVLAVMCFPFYRAIANRLKNRPRLASFLATLIVLLIILVPAGLVLALFIMQASSTLDSFDLRQTFAKLFSAPIYQNYILPYTNKLEQQFGIDIDLFAILTQFGKNVVKYLYGFSPQVLAGTATFIVDFFIMLFTLYVLFLEGPRLIRLGIQLSPLRETHEQRLLAQFKNTIDGTVYGYLLTSLVQAFLATIGFSIIGVPAPLVWGTLTFFLCLVPVVGAAGVWLPISLWLFLQGNTAKAIGLLIYGAVVISGIDNILKPLIIKGRIKVHPLLIFLSLFGGVAIFGPIGILLGPIIIALFIATIAIYREEFI